MQFCKYLIIFLVGSLPAGSFAQDITGLWKGTLYNDSTQKYYRYEIGISEEKGKLSGFSHTFFLDGDKEFYGVKKVKLKKRDDKIIIEDAGLIANNYPIAPAKGVRQLNVLTLDIKDSIMTLSGPFTTNRTKEYAPLTGTVSLQRKNDFWQSALVPHLQELGLSDELSFVKKENEKQKEITASKEIAVRENPAGQTTTVVTKQNDIASDQPKKVSETASATPGKSSTNKDAGINVAVNPGPEKNKEPVDLSKKEKKQENANAVNETTASTATQAKQLKERQAAQSTKVIPVNEAEPKVIVPAAEVNQRVTVLQQAVYFSSDSLQISLYDNGEVDGDTVSVLMNGKIIMAKEGLSTKAVQKTIYAGQNKDDIELVMYAENLGAIAPNTGLLVVHDGKSIYEIRFSGDLQKNASIILRRRKN